MRYWSAFVHKCAIIAAAVIVVVTALGGWRGRAQDIPFAEAIRPSRWDASSKTLFVGRGGLSKDNYEPIRAFKDGMENGPKIDLFRDFPGLQTAVVDDIASGPNGTVLVAAVLGYGKSNLRHTLLTYSATGSLSAIWDTEPYYIEAVAVGDNGDIYALGNRLDIASGDYPLLNVYDSHGQLLHQGLDSRAFKQGPSAIDQSHEMWNPSIAIHGNRLYIYASQENAAVISTLDGEIVKNLNLSSVLTKLAADQGLSEATIHNIVFNGDSELILDVTLHARGAQAFDPTKPHAALISVNSDATGYDTLKLTPRRDWVLLTADQDRIDMLATGTSGFHMSTTSRSNGRLTN